MLPNNANEPIRVCKVTIVGDEAVGKSCLVQKILNPKQPMKSLYEKTVGVDFSVKKTRSKGVNIKLTLWDPSGCDRFRTLISSYYRGAEQIVLVFDVNNESSFEHIASKYMEEIKQFANCKRKPCLILVGTQCDWIGESARVSKATIDDFVQRYNMFYHEVSSKNGQGIEGLIAMLEENAIKEEYSLLVQERFTGATQPRRSSASRKVLVTTVLAAGTCIIGYGLFCYKAQLAVLIATQAVPALLVGLAILAAIAAYRICRPGLTMGASLFHSQQPVRGRQQEQPEAMASALAL